MSALVLGGSAVVPSMLLLWYIRSRDRNPEPRGLVLKTFLLGALICVPVVPLSTTLESLGLRAFPGLADGALAKAFLGAAIPEELLKFLVLRWYVWRQSAFDEPLDGVVYGATASLGFATLENILYVGEHGLAVAVVRAITAVPGHAFTGVVMGAYVGRARFAEPARRFGLLAAGFFWATLLHGAYDAFLFTNTSLAFLALGVLAIEVAWGRRLYKALQREQELAVPMFAGQVTVAQAGVFSGGVVAAQVVTEVAVLEARPAAPPPRESSGAWWKLALGGVGLSLCALWLLGLVAATVLAWPPEDAVSAVVLAVLWVVSLVPPTLCFLLFRSGLRGLD
ncbi:PrsW family intramembrane metalloprotease [Myxococcaceae bacterium GXIMD 01537]